MALSKEVAELIELNVCIRLWLDNMNNLEPPEAVRLDSRNSKESWEACIQDYQL